MVGDAVQTNPDLYRIVFENDRVRVLEYHDQPGARTVPHRHPDSVMVTLSPFRRRLEGTNDTVDVELPAGVTRWLDAQEHAGENIGETDTRVLLIELKEIPVVGAPLGKPRVGPS
jgi:beta-alanine degradation protein BauB